MENAKRPYRLTGQEIVSTVKHLSRLPLLVQPLFNPEHQNLTKTFAEEFTSAFIKTMLDEGDQAINYISHLTDDQKNRLRQVLEIGSTTKSEYLSKEKTLKISDLGL